MLALDRFSPVPEEVVGAFETPADGEVGIVPAAIEVPGHAGAFCCRVALVGASDAAAGPQALAVALAEERSDLGAGLVEGLWFDRPATLWVPRASSEEGMDAWRLRVHVWRCHIAGPVFSGVLVALRAHDPEADIASVWELRVGMQAGGSEPARTVCVDGRARLVPSQVRPVAVPCALPCAREPTSAPRPELHLDTLALREASIAS